MGRSIITRLFYDLALQHDTFVLPGGSSVNVDFYIADINGCRGIIEVSYASTSGTTGISVTQFEGNGPKDPTFEGLPWCAKGAAANTAASAPFGTSVAIFANNGNTLTMSTVTPSSTNVVARTSFSLADPNKTNQIWQRLQFTNNDTTNNATIRVYLTLE